MTFNTSSVIFASSNSGERDMTPDNDIEMIAIIAGLVVITVYGLVHWLGGVL